MAKRPARKSAAPAAALPFEVNAAGRPPLAGARPRAARVTVPYLTEPWYC